MYIVSISLIADKIPANNEDSLFEGHRKWFAKYFKKGNFLILGPYLDATNAGVIIATAKDRSELDKILAEDVYHPLELAKYEIREFHPAMVAKNIEVSD